MSTLGFLFFTGEIMRSGQPSYAAIAVHCLSEVGQSDQSLATYLPFIVVFLGLCGREVFQPHPWILGFSYWYLVYA